MSLVGVIFCGHRASVNIVHFVDNSTMKSMLNPLFSMREWGCSVEVCRLQEIVNKADASSALKSDRNPGQAWRYWPPLPDHHRNRLKITLLNQRLVKDWSRFEE